jgi:hypothetical protein
MNEQLPDHIQLLNAVSALDIKVDKLAESVKGVVSAFDTVSDAFKVLEAIGKIAKPLLWIVSACTGLVVAYHWLIDHIKQWFSHLAK